MTSSFLSAFLSAFLFILSLTEDAKSVSKLLLTIPKKVEVITKNKCINFNIIFELLIFNCF